MNDYNVDSIVKLEEIEHVRRNSGMWVGDGGDASRLLEEILDNSLDEVSSGYATVIGCFINTQDNSFKILDNGRGIPFDQSKPIEEDPPVMICNSLFTSGKFNKTDGNSAYTIAAGLHGVGLTAVRALSDYMMIDIYRGNIHATYKFTYDGTIERSQETFSGDKQPYSTKIEVKPAKQYFTDINIDIKLIEERLRIATTNYPNLKIAFVIDGKNRVITCDENKLISDYIGPDIDWVKFYNHKNPESYDIRVGWDLNPPTAVKSFTTVNLCKVSEGAHINNVLSVIKKYFQNYIGKTAPDGKTKYNFQPNDSLIGFRLYINLKIVKASFAEQVKNKLSSRSDLSIMDNFETKFSDYMKKNQEVLYSLLDTFQAYRSNITNKKLVGSNATGNKRGFTILTKLIDCKYTGGELLIGEGQSAVGGLIQTRDNTKHAILPLRGVVANAITKNDLMENQELKDLVIACGCGVDDKCDTSKLRYNKIILAADADPAGNFITALLISFFAYKMSPVIKEGRLFVCQTPLFGYKEKGKFTPIWTDNDLETARKAGKKIKRYKGLGGFNPDELKVFTLDEPTRRLIQVQWSEEHHEKLFRLMSNSEDRKELILNKWTL